MPALGVYIHYPWCRNLCPYCDFPVVVARPGREPPHDDYRDAILRELDERAGDFSGRALVSIYLGGGTPSLWRPEAIAQVLAAAAGRFGAALDTLEVTLEANPTDCTAERMAAWRAAGINRLSIGVQSLDAGDLEVLGRDHRMGDGQDALAAALGAGFRSLSADLILGAPPPPSRPRPIGRRADLDPRSAPPSVRALARSGAPHLSVYELTIEPRTLLGRRVARDLVAPLDDDVLAELYQASHQALEEAGYQHYEVSSYARPGHRAVHNSLYWSGGEYLGLGVGAASFRVDAAGTGWREVNHRQLARWRRATGADRIADTTASPPAELAVDQLWLALRTSDGAPLASVAPGLRDRLLGEGLCEVGGDRLRPTLRGFLYNDRIARHVVTAGSSIAPGPRSPGGGAS